MGYSGLTITPRYIPIDQFVIPNMSRIGTREAPLLNITSRDSQGLFYGLGALDLASLISILLFILIMVIAIIYIFSAISPQRLSSGSASIEKLAKSLNEARGASVDYRYDGAKLILRRVYLELRRRARCSSCTPRELARGGYAPRGFADLYEDVVYGNIEADVYEELRRIGLYPGERGDGNG